MLGSTKYTRGVDIWAVGVILGEMLNGRPAFPGTSTMNQIEKILEVTHYPSQADIDAIQSPFAATMLQSITEVKMSNIGTDSLTHLLTHSFIYLFTHIGDIFPSASAEAIDLMSKCFSFDPKKRPSAIDLLGHSYVTDFHNADEEPSYPYGSVRLPLDDNTKLTEADYREKLYEEIANRRKESRRKEGQAGGATGR